jgi:hypothetical protein
LAEKGINIANMTVSRSEKLANMVIEMDHKVENDTLGVIQSFPWVRFARLVEPITDGSSRYEK